MNRIYLEYHDAQQNKHRFYQLFIMQGLFDEWSLIREWGRVGSGGTIKKDLLETETEALLAKSTLSQQKINKSYYLVL